MKSLTEFICEQIDSNYIIKNAEKFDTLSDLFTKAGFSKKRHNELEVVCKKAIGDGPYYAVNADDARQAYADIMTKADTYIGKNGFVDLINLNKDLKDNDESIESKKISIKNALFSNKKLKELGLTDEMDSELKKMNALFKEEPITLERELRVNTDKGQAVVNIYPAMCIVDNKLITGVQFMSDFYLGRGSKFLYVFSDSSLSNVKN